MKITKRTNRLTTDLPEPVVDTLGHKPSDSLHILGTARTPLPLPNADTRAAALQRMAARGWTLPARYRFDRDDTNSR